MQWLSFTRIEKIKLKLQNGWIWPVQRCGRSWRSSRTPERPLNDQGAEENGVTAPLNYTKIRGKATTKPSPKLQNLGHCRRFEQINHALGIERQTGVEALEDAASAGAYGLSCGHEGTKLQGNHPEDGRRHTADRRVSRTTRNSTSSRW